MKTIYFIVQDSGMKYLYQRTVLQVNCDITKASIFMRHFSDDMELATRTNNCYLVHMSEISSPKQSSESVKTPSSVALELDLIEKPSTIESLNVYVLNKWPHFSRLVFTWLFLKQVKNFSDVGCSLEITYQLRTSVKCSVINIFFQCQNLHIHKIYQV